MEEQNKWLRHLIWCPSQILYNFIDPKTEIPYQLYLRWRHEDPWTANLYICTDETFCDWKDSVNEFSISESFESIEYNKLELYCLEKLRTMFPHIEFTSPVL